MTKVREQEKIIADIKEELDNLRKYGTAQK